MFFGFVVAFWIIYTLAVWGCFVFFGKTFGRWGAIAVALAGIGFPAWLYGSAALEKASREDARQHAATLLRDEQTKLCVAKPADFITPGLHREGAIGLLPHTGRFGPEWPVPELTRLEGGVVYLIDGYGWLSRLNNCIDLGKLDSSCRVAPPDYTVALEKKIVMPEGNTPAFARLEIHTLILRQRAAAREVARRVDYVLTGHQIEQGSCILSGDAFKKDYGAALARFIDSAIPARLQK